MNQLEKIDDSAVSVLPEIPTLAQIFRLENELKKHPALEIPPKHYFAKGIYAREIFIPKGTILTGKIHKTEHINVISQGEITVWTETGMKRIKAPFTMVSQPGTKRVGYTHEDTVWTTFHGTAETDLEKLELELIDSQEYLIEQENKQCHGSLLA